MTSKERKHIEQLEKRKLCLERRIEVETTSETPAQKAELAALDWALRKIKASGSEENWDAKTQEIMFKDCI